MEQALQVTGAIAILAAFVAQQAGWLEPRSWTYLLLNLIGAATLAVLAARGRDWGFLLLEGTWAAVAAVGIALRMRARGRPGTPPPRR